MKRTFKIYAILLIFNKDKDKDQGWMVEEDRSSDLAFAPSDPPHAQQEEVARVSQGIPKVLKLNLFLDKYLPYRWPHRAHISVRREGRKQGRRKERRKKGRMKERRKKGRKKKERRDLSAFSQVSLKLQVSLGFGAAS